MNKQFLLQFEFPDVSLADDGLLAVGGDLSSERLISAYSQGVFPWYNPGDPILWWSPDLRCIFLLGSFKPSTSLLRNIKRFGYSHSFDLSFNAVIEACAAPREYSAGTWIDGDMQAAYCRLHELGVAHSVETWHRGKLVGGLYGLAIGKVFFGESMFSFNTDASKAALWYLIQHLIGQGFEMIDGQVSSPHLLSLGAIEIGRVEFMKKLRSGISASAITENWKRFNH